MNDSERAAREERAREGDDRRGCGPVIWIVAAALAGFGLLVWLLFCPPLPQVGPACTGAPLIKPDKQNYWINQIIRLS